MTSVTIGELFSKAEAELAEKIFREDPRNFVARAQAEVVEPAMERINKATGQQNDARYIAYMLQAALQASSG